MRKKLVANSFINLVGQTIPFAVGIFAIRYIIKGLGIEEFGLLTLIWAGLGYLTFLDLGLSRGLIKFLSEGFARGDRNKNASYLWYSLIIMTGMGFLGTVLVSGSATFLVDVITEIPRSLQYTAVSSIRTMGFMIPLVIWTSALRGVLEADLKFVISNALNILNGLCNYVVPVVVIAAGGDLARVMFYLLISRAIIFLIHVGVIFTQYPELRSFQKLPAEDLRGFLSFGGWATVSNIINPMMVYFDRFVLSSILPVAQIAYYTTPYELISRMFIIPAAITRSLFPEMAKTGSELKVSADLFLQSFKYIMISMFGVCFVLIVVAKLGLTIWLGEDFAENSYLILQILAVGIFINALLNVPFTYLQSCGRPDVTAKVHAVELPFYFAILIFMTRHYGLIGAAMTWGIKNLVELFILCWIALRLDADLRGILKFSIRRMLILTLGLALPITIAGVAASYLISAVILITSIWFIWEKVFDARDREFIKGYLRGRS